jgi:hypothetical protein
MRGIEEAAALELPEHFDMKHLILKDEETPTRVRENASAVRRDTNAESRTYTNVIFVW